MGANFDPTRQSDWTCAHCGANGFDTISAYDDDRADCPNCGASLDLADLDGPHFRPSGKPGGSWKCAQCESWNMNERTSCVMCGNDLALLEANPVHDEETAPMPVMPSGFGASRARLMNLSKETFYSPFYVSDRTPVDFALFDGPGHVPGADGSQDAFAHMLTNMRTGFMFAHAETVRVHSWRVRVTNVTPEMLAMFGASKVALQVSDRCEAETTLLDLFLDDMTIDVSVAARQAVMVKVKLEPTSLRSAIDSLRSETVDSRDRSDFVRIGGELTQAGNRLPGLFPTPIAVGEHKRELGRIAEYLKQYRVPTTSVVKPAIVWVVLRGDVARPAC